jgi:hypothetical protein
VRVVQPGPLPLNTNARRLHDTQRLSDSISRKTQWLRYSDSSAVQAQTIQRAQGPRSMAFNYSIKYRWIFGGGFLLSCESRVRVQIPNSAGKPDEHDHQHLHIITSTVYEPCAPGRPPRNLMRYCGGVLTHTAACTFSPVASRYIYIQRLISPRLGNPD